MTFSPLNSDSSGAILLCYGRCRICPSDVFLLDSLPVITITHGYANHQYQNVCCYYVLFTSTGTVPMFRDIDMLGCIKTYGSLISGALSELVSWWRNTYVIMPMCLSSLPYHCFHVRVVSIQNFMLRMEGSVDQSFRCESCGLDMGAC